MELKEFFEVSVLMSYYKNLLSDKQRIYMIEHFEEDYSLSEIASKHNVSRQAIYDNIKRGIHLLKEYEEKIGMNKREIKIKEILLDLRKDFNIKNLDKIISSFDM